MDSVRSHETLQKLHTLCAVCSVTVYAHILDNSYIVQVRFCGSLTVILQCKRN